MSANATWWVRYTDRGDPHGRQHLLSLASPDLADPRKARKRAAATAKARLAKRGVKAAVIDVRCVG